MGSDTHQLRRDLLACTLKGGMGCCQISCSFSACNPAKHKLISRNAPVNIVNADRPGSTP
jgi:hypothetical protein